MNDIHKTSANLKFIVYAVDTTIASPLFSFTHGGNDDISLVEALINLELSKISDWLAVNKLTQNVKKKNSWFSIIIRVISANEILNLIICETNIERVTTFNFLGITINEFINWNVHTSKIANVAGSWRWRQHIRSFNGVLFPYNGFIWPWKTKIHIKIQYNTLQTQLHISTHTSHNN